MEAGYFQKQEGQKQLTDKRSDIVEEQKGHKVPSLEGP